MNRNSSPSARPAIKFAETGAVVASSSPQRRTVQFDKTQKGNTKRSQTARSSQVSSVEEIKLEGEVIRETVEALFKAVTAGSGLAGGGSNKALDTLYDLFAQIIKTPYIDLYRMLDLAQYRSKFGKFPEAQKLLEDIGFRTGSSSQHLVFPYDQTLPRMMIAKELLHGKVAKKREEFSYSDF
jgi:hypothetical protein